MTFLFIGAGLFGWFALGFGALFLDIYLDVKKGRKFGPEYPLFLFGPISLLVMVCSFIKLKFSHRENSNIFERFDEKLRLRQ